MRKNNKRFSLLLGAMGLLICAGLPAVAFAGYQLLHALAPGDAPTAVAASATPAGTAAPVTQCGGPPAMFILLIGTDARADSYAVGLGDSIRIVRVDFVRPGLAVLAFQRDLYVEIPEISDHGITHGKLNQAYLYGNAAYGYYDGAGEGPGLLALTLQQNFGARIDHFVAVNMQNFVRIIDALGGLDVNLPYTVNGGRNERYFRAGNQHLDGYRALLLARMRPEGDFRRTETQNLILLALAAKLLSPALLPALPELANSRLGAVQTDLGPEQLTSLLCLAPMIDPQNVVAVNFPEELFTGTRVQDPVLGRTFIWEVDFNLLRAYTEYFNNSGWPGMPLAPPQPPAQ